MSAISIGVEDKSKMVEVIDRDGNLNRDAVVRLVPAVTDAEKAHAYIERINDVMVLRLRPILDELEAEGFVADFEMQDVDGRETLVCFCLEKRFLPKDAA